MKKFDSVKFKRLVTIVCAISLFGWVAFRFSAIGAENAMKVFNPSRSAADIGAPVLAMTVSRQDGVITEPLAVKNNRAYVSGSRVSNLAPGQRVGDGKIISVSSSIDLDSGMHVVRTAGVSDGLQNAEYRANGYFVPTYAIVNDTVYVVEDGFARARSVSVARQDADNSLISSGLQDGDVVILSKVQDGDKVQVK